MDILCQKILDFKARHEEGWRIYRKCWLGKWGEQGSLVQNTLRGRQTWKPVAPHPPICREAN